MLWLLVFLATDVIGTLLLIRQARKDPMLRERIDAAFGAMIHRKEKVVYVEKNEDGSCPFCD